MEVVHDHWVYSFEKDDYNPPEEAIDLQVAEYKRQEEEFVSGEIITIIIECTLSHAAAITIAPIRAEEIMAKSCCKKNALGSPAFNRWISHPLFVQVNIHNRIKYITDN